MQRCIELIWNKLEPEFTNHIKTIISNSVSTYETASANAKRNHAMYARIFTCTPSPLRNSGGKKIAISLRKTLLIAGKSL